ncbi:Coiled-coil domain-containing protein r3hcc1l [Cichlidogyrus casuarinus]|uniref:Coiled-coil domain-containing protein r3hcc1l n=1 Tax=Cichlidogyrus casuarinus TaxID=1844966 RepID=A0ABD2PW66_9PLAT
MSKETENQKVEIKLYVPPCARNKNTSGTSVNSEKSANIASKLKSLNSSKECNDLDGISSGLLNVSLEDKSEKLNFDDFAHILEVFGFDKSFKEFDFDDIFRPICDNDFSIKWIDDEHCLLITESNSMAQRVIEKYGQKISPFRIRKLSEADPVSIKKITNSSGDWTKPFKKRPETDTYLAHRLISAALGMKPKKELAQPSQILVDTLKEKERIKKIQDALWND